MCQITKTGVKGYSDEIYSIQELSKMHLQMMLEGLHLLRENLVKSENADRHKLVVQLDLLKESFKIIDL